MDYESYQSLEVTRAGRVVTVSLNRPEIRNAIDAGLHRELGRIFIDLDMDDECDVAILTGSGGYFCAGGDLNWVLSLHGDPYEAGRAFGPIAGSKTACSTSRSQSSPRYAVRPLVWGVRWPCSAISCTPHPKPSSPIRMYQ